MVIIGTENQLHSKDIFLLKKQFPSLSQVTIEGNDDVIIQKIQTIFTQKSPSYLILNLDKDISIAIEGYLEDLRYNGVKILSFYDFSKQFLNKCPVSVNEKNYKVLRTISKSAANELLRRSFDMLFSLFALLLLSPILLLIAIAIKIISPGGPIFFGHKRIGKDGKFFHVYKFRTMVPNAEKILREWLEKNPEIKEEYEKDFKLKNDPRILPILGNFLRKSSLDELPQFFNSLIGEMSVVGPRPIVENELKKYHRFAPKLLSVKPGVTGLWQVSGRNDIDYDERIALDMEYIDTRSFWLDIKLILQTVLVMLFNKGAY